MAVQPQERGEPVDRRWASGLEATTGNLAVRPALMAAALVGVVRVLADHVDADQGPDPKSAPLPTSMDAGRRIRAGNSDQAGAAGRGLRRRDCAVGLELCCSAGRLATGRSADPVEPCCHGLNIATVRAKRYLKRYLKRKTV